MRGVVVFFAGSAPWRFWIFLWLAPFFTSSLLRRRSGLERASRSFSFRREPPLESGHPLPRICSLLGSSASLAAVSTSMCAADGSNHGLHSVYAERRFQQRPSLVSRAHPSTLRRSSLPIRRLVGVPPLSAGLCPWAGVGVRVGTPHAFGARCAEAPQPRL